MNKYGNNLCSSKTLAWRLDLKKKNPPIFTFFRMALDVCHSVALAALQVQPLSALGLQSCMYYADLMSYAFNGQGLLPDGSWSVTAQGPLCIAVSHVLPCIGNPILDTAPRTAEEYTRNLVEMMSLSDNCGAAPALAAPDLDPCAAAAATPFVEIAARFVSSMPQHDLSAAAQRAGTPWGYATALSTPEPHISQVALMEYATHPARGYFFHLLYYFCTIIADHCEQATAQQQQQQLQQPLQHPLQQQQQQASQQQPSPSQPSQPSDSQPSDSQPSQPLLQQQQQQQQQQQDRIRLLKHQSQLCPASDMTNFLESVQDFMNVVKTEEAAEAMLRFLASDEFVQWPGASWKQSLWSHILSPAHAFDWNETPVDMYLHPRYQVLLQETVKRNAHDQFALYYVRRYAAAVRRIQGETRYDHVGRSMGRGYMRKDTHAYAGGSSADLKGSGSAEKQMAQSLPTLEECAHLSPFHRYVLGLMAHSASAEDRDARTAVSPSFSKEVWSIEPRHNRSQLALLRCGVGDRDCIANPELAKLNAHVCLESVAAAAAAAAANAASGSERSLATQVEKLMEHNFVAVAVALILNQAADSRECKELFGRFFPDSSIVPNLFEALVSGDEQVAPILLCELALKRTNAIVAEAAAARPRSSNVWHDQYGSNSFSQGNDSVSSSPASDEASSHWQTAISWLSQLCQLGQPVACIELAKLVPKPQGYWCAGASFDAWERKVVAYLRDVGPVLGMAEAVKLLGPRAHSAFF